MLNIGDRVLFKAYGKDIPEYYTNHNGIPMEMIIHGRSIQQDPRNGGIVEGFYGDKVIVSYIDERDNKTQLGFLEKDLIKNDIVGFYEAY